MRENLLTPLSVSWKYSSKSHQNLDVIAKNTISKKNENMTPISNTLNLCFVRLSGSIMNNVKEENVKSMKFGIENHVHSVRNTYIKVSQTNQRYHGGCLKPMPSAISSMPKATRFSIKLNCVPRSPSAAFLALSTSSISK